MNIENFKIFFDLAGTGSFSQSAKLNGITQSAVSQQIRAMEKKLGVTLVDRTQKQLSLTPEGVLLQKRAREIYAQYERVCSELHDLKNVISGTVRVGAVYSSGINALHLAIRHFISENPNTNLQLFFDEGPIISSKIAQGALDIGIVIGDKHSRVEDVVPLAEEPLIAICSPGNTLAKQDSTSLQELRVFPFITFNEESITRKIIDQAFKNEMLEYVPTRSFNNVEVIISAVEANCGVAIVPENSVKRKVASGSLVALPIRGVKISRPVVAITRKGRPTTPAIKKFIEILVRY